MLERLTVSATRLRPSGAWQVSAIVGGFLVSRRYLGYSKRDAVRLFRTEVVSPGATPYAVRQHNDTTTATEV